MTKQLEFGGHIKLDYPEGLRDAVSNAAESWMDFCAQDDEAKNQFAMTNHHDGIGYENGLLQDGGDPRENFGFSTSSDEEISPDSEASEKLIDAATMLSRLVVPSIARIGQEIEDAACIEGYTEIAERSAGDAFYRFLHYYPQEQGSVIAKAHADHSGFTMHLFESTGGCEALDAHGEWQPHDVEDDTLAAFAGMQTQLVSKGEIKALSHRVVANETCARAGRFAIVCFVGFKDAPRYDKSKNGSLLNQQPGFNYTMNHEDFRGLFK